MVGEFIDAVETAAAFTVMVELGRNAVAWPGGVLERHIIAWIGRMAERASYPVSYREEAATTRFGRPLAIWRIETSSGAVEYRAADCGEVGYRSGRWVPPS